MKFLEEIKKLNLPKDKFAVFGSGPLAIRNIREVRDVDIIVKDDLWVELKKKYPVDSDLIRIGNIDIFHNWQTFDDVNELIDDADIFEAIRFVKLKYMISWKEKRGQEKDKTDLELIKDYLKSNKKD